MIPQDLSPMWPAFAPAIANHLWQSTLFAIVAGSLTLVLRKSHARARYWLWLSASVKFLIPFSLLVSIGGHLAWLRGTAGTKAGLYLAMDEVTQPFAQPATSLISRSTPPPASTSLIHLLPVLCTAVWLCGFVAALCLWYVRWRRISAVVQKALPLQEGREVETLRRLERNGGIRKPVEMLLSLTSLEPGIFGIVRPVLVWPEGISERLEDAHLEVILAHELWHVRRRDNLAAAIHMVVEAIFWVHPLVWWLGARLVEERERACDEAVLAAGSDRKTYAESILKICEFCVGSPLTCVSGVTGADLKRRIARIMTERVGRKLDFSRKLLLSATGLVAVALPVMLGLLHATQTRAEFQAQNITRIVSQAAQAEAGQTPVVSEPTPDWQAEAGGLQVFVVASVKQNNSGSDSSTMNVPIGPGDVYPHNGGLFSGSNVSLISYIYFAYKLTGSQLQLLIPHLPQWVLKDRFDIQARADGNPTKDQMRLMVQSLLADRFKLVIHYETQQLPVFALVVSTPGKTGPQLQPHPNDSSCAAVPSPTSPTSGLEPPSTVAGGLPADCGGIIGMPSTPSGRMRVGARNVPIRLLANSLAQMGNFDRAVLDQTRLSGTFDFTFEWTAQHNRPLPSGVIAPLDEPGPMFLEDLKEQLGLNLEPQTAPTEVFAIDRVERPSGN